MMISRVLLLFAALPVICNATWEAPFSGQCRLLDKIVDRLQQTSLTLTLLERVALGRTTDITAQEENRAGLRAGALREREFAESTVRACAFRKIGELHLEEARTFLTNLSRKDIGLDTTHELWPAAQIALRNASLIRLTTNPEKRLFLEKVLTQPHDGVGAVWMWAANELCDRGELLSIGIIQHSIRSLYIGSEQFAEREIAFCEERMQVLSKHPERLKALGSILKASGDPADRLVRWAINQLAATGTPDADAELIRFATEINDLPAGSQRRRLAKYRTSVDRVFRLRAASKRQR